MTLHLSKPVTGAIPATGGVDGSVMMEVLIAFQRGDDRIEKKIVFFILLPFLIKISFNEVCPGYLS